MFYTAFDEKILKKQHFICHGISVYEYIMNGVFQLDH